MTKDKRGRLSMREVEMEDGKRIMPVVFDLIDVLLMILMLLM